MWLIASGCSTAAGAGKKNLWTRLLSGKTSPLSLEESGILRNKEELLPNYNIHLRRDLPTTLSHRERLGKKLAEAWQELSETPGAEKVLATGSVGVILASTKGFLEDVIWQEGATFTDTLTPLLEDFLKLTKIKSARQMVVSNACSSTAAALKLAESWFTAQAVDHIVIVSADTIGEFVVRGFHSLQALTPHAQAQPFDQHRAGLQLGEGAAVLLLSRETESEFKIRAVGLNCEGVAATRPDEEGRSLYLALSEALKDAEKPSLIVAHGTGTALNDSTEDFVFGALYNGEKSPSVTGTKWGVGHTLGVSCAIDLIAASEILKNKKAFALPFTQKIDAKFHGTGYLTSTTAFTDSAVLISSLGFGGVHAGVHLAKEGGR